MTLQPHGQPELHMRDDRVPAFEERDLPDEAATQALAHELSLFLQPGDCICLSGELGAGKTALARSIIHSLWAGVTPGDVPSPTFTMVQTYHETRLPVAHFDLYRVADAGEVEELGLRDLIADHVVLIEWPERLGGDLPADRLDIRLVLHGSARRARINGHGRLQRALSRMSDIREFLTGQGLHQARRLFMQGDASKRRYERLAGAPHGPTILMDMPSRGPEADAADPYGRVAHLAQDASAVVAIAKALNEAGFSSPRIHAHDLERGLVLLEDFGHGVYADLARAGKPMEEPLTAAVEMLCEIAGRAWPSELALPGGGSHRVPQYDEGALWIEAELVLEWLWPGLKGAMPDAAARETYRAAWQPLLASLQSDRQVWVLRDYHSPNLIWLPQREGIRRVGLIDTQDCVQGSPAYDLVSLLQDARIDVADDLEARLLARYCGLRRQREPGFDETALRRSYAILGAQRASKVLGIFHRLARRDGKTWYLQNCPRVARSLSKDLRHPALATLRDWFERHLLEELRHKCD